MAQTKYICFTRYANHGILVPAQVEEELQRLCTYYCFQEEICPETQRLHLQGYCILTASTRLTTFARRFRCHAERRRGTHSQAKAYCSKEETRREGGRVYEYGVEPAPEPGRRRDLQEFTDALLSGRTNWELLDEGFAQQLAKYPRYMQLVRTTKLQHDVLQNLPNFQPRLNWQFALGQVLAAQPTPREVLWKWDQTGNTGKSFFALHYKAGQSFVVTSGKHADIHYAYGFEKYVFFDWPRCNEGSFPYGLVEQFKNGYFLSTKYESVAKRFPVPHVVVFANFAPDISQMSLDRWNIEEIQ